MGPAHLAVGLAARRAAPSAPLGAMLVATEAADILWGAFFLAGMDSLSYAPWSHGLFMSAVWSVVAALLAARIYRDYRAGAVIGLLVFSHWVLDFISHPMWPSTVPDLPLLFDGSPRVGLGLYSSLDAAIAVEIGVLVLGVVVYLVTRRRTTVEARG